MHVGNPVALVAETMAAAQTQPSWSRSPTMLPAVTALEDAVRMAPRSFGRRQQAILR